MDTERPAQLPRNETIVNAIFKDDLPYINHLHRKCVPVTDDSGPEKALSLKDDNNDEEEEERRGEERRGEERREERRGEDSRVEVTRRERTGQETKAE